MSAAELRQWLALAARPILGALSRYPQNISCERHILRSRRQHCTTQCSFTVAAILMAPMLTVATSEHAEYTICCYRWFPAFRDRLMGNPRFLLVLAIEEIIGCTAKTIAEYQARGKDFWKVSCCTPKHSHDFSVSVKGWHLLAAGS